MTVTTNVVSMDGTQAVRDRKYFADKISSELRKSVESIINAGKWLIAAKSELPHGEFLKMVERDLKIASTTAQRLMIIARHPLISNASNSKLLPTSWDTLYNLTTLPEDVVRKGLRDGSINKNTMGKDVRALKTASNSNNKKEEETTHAEPKATPMHSLDEVRKDYARKAKMLTPAEREAEVEAIAKALTSAPASTTTPDVKHAVEQFAAVVRKLPREQRVNAVADVIDAVAVMESDVRHETDRRAKERGEVSYLKTPKLLVRSNHHDY